jgi:predicted NACHT family NTPase
VQRLTANPLLLTILALIHRNGDRLPNRRVKLYELAVQTLTQQGAEIIATQFLAESLQIYRYLDLQEKVRAASRRDNLFLGFLTLVPRCQF